MSKRSGLSKGAKLPSNAEHFASDGRLLMAEQSRTMFTTAEFEGPNADRRSDPLAVHTPFPELPGVDAAFLEPLRALPSPVTIKEAVRAFAPMVHKAEIGTAVS